jgi:pSer/pThr/pTyr-binding forkhead associated (FHA) protein
LAVSLRPKKFNRKYGAAKSQEAKRGFVLVELEGNNPGKEHLFEDVATMGRVEDNTLVLLQAGVSRHHARISYADGVHELEDLKSANGTRLNGEILSHEKEVLRDGDYITLGQATLQFSVIAKSSGEITARTRLSSADAERADKTKESVMASENPRRARRGRLIMIATALVVGLGLIAFLLRGESKDEGTTDLSDQPLTYSDDDLFFNAVFGMGQYDQSHPRQAMVDFEYLGDHVTLRYGATGVDRLGEVEIHLNDQKVGQVPLTMSRWVYGLKLVLPRKTLITGKTNRLVFKNMRNPVHNDSWEVCYVQLVQRAMPAPDPNRARRQFERARKAWDDREVAPSNMYSALVGFQSTLDLLEKLETRPALYQEASDFLDRVDRALTKRFQEGLFSARRHEKVDGDQTKAIKALRLTLRYFRKDDFRYREVQQRLDQFSGR